MRDIDEFETALELLANMRSIYLEASNLLESKAGSIGHLIANGLMAVTCKHTDAFLSVAMIPEPGSHIETEWSIVRSLYELAVTALWLVYPENENTQKRRLLKYMKAETHYFPRMRGEFDAASGQLADSPESKFLELDQLLREAHKKENIGGEPKMKPDFRQMMKECGIPDRQYSEFYSSASHRMHGGSSSILNWFEARVFQSSQEPDYLAWFTPIHGVSWAFGDGGATILGRQGAPEGLVRALRDARTELSGHLALCAPQEDTPD